MIVSDLGSSLVPWPSSTTIEIATNGKQSVAGRWVCHKYARVDTIRLATGVRSINQSINQTNKQTYKQTAAYLCEQLAADGRGTIADRRLAQDNLALAPVLVLTLALENVEEKER